MNIRRLSTAACGLALAASITFGGTATAQSVNSLPAAVISGSCAEPGEVVATLRDVRPQQGEIRGSDTALAVWESDSEIDISLNTLLASPHAIMVGDSASPVACGDIGGVVDDDEDLMIGLHAVENPGYFGVADIDGDDDDDETDIDLYIVQPAS